MKLRGLNVKPTLGDKLFAKVLEYLNNEQSDKDENLEILLMVASIRINEMIFTC